MEVALPQMPVRAGERHQQQQRVHRRIAPRRRQRPDRVGRAVDPQIVAVDAEERRVAEQRQGTDEPAAGLEQPRALVRDRHLDIMDPRVQMRLQRVGQIMDVDHGAPDSGAAQPIEDMVDQRLAGDADQRLGPRGGERAHPLAQAGRHHHRHLRHAPAGIGAQRQRPLRAHAASTIGSPRRPSGTLASNHARTGASAGWARSRSR